MLGNVGHISWTHYLNIRKRQWPANYIKGNDVHQAPNKLNQVRVAIVSQSKNKAKRYIRSRSGACFSDKDFRFFKRGIYVYIVIVLDDRGRCGKNKKSELFLFSRGHSVRFWAPVGFAC